MKGILTNGNESQNFLNARNSMSRFEKAGHTEWDWEEPGMTG